MTSWLRHLQERYGETLDEALLAALSGPAEVSDFFGMMQYQFGYVDQKLTRISPAGGKRFRPMLALLACEAVGGSWHDAVGIASAIELLHNFSLIHDDIEDRDPTRRHRPTVWAIWEEPKAINVGDAVFALAIRTALHGTSDPTVAHGLTVELARVALELTTGQHLDMTFETRENVSTDEYLGMIERKTASLIAYSLYAGGLMGARSSPQANTLHRFGWNLGKAFQIHDDVMGIWGASDDTGKTTGKDLINRKKTLPVLLLLELGAQDDVQFLRRFLRRENDEVAQVQTSLDRNGIYESSRRQVEKYLDLAFQALSETAIDAPYIAQFEAIAAEVSGYRPPSN